MPQSTVSVDPVVAFKGMTGSALGVTSIMSPITIRPATAEDAPLISDLIHALAEYERMSDLCTIAPEQIREQLFGPHPAAEAIIAEYEGKPQGFAIYFTTFSTFIGRPGIYLEDLFVRPEHRGSGLGKALLLQLVEIAKQRNYGRVEWAVLHWNEDAIGFYKKLGAKPMDTWHIYRLDEEAIDNLAK